MLSPELVKELSPEMQSCIEVTCSDAYTRRIKFISIEHLILKMLDAPDVVRELVARAVNVPVVHKDLEDWLRRNTETFPPKEEATCPETMLNFSRVIERAKGQVSSKYPQTVVPPVAPLDVLIALLDENHSIAKTLLRANGLKGKDMQELRKGIPKKKSIRTW